MSMFSLFSNPGSTFGPINLFSFWVWEEGKEKEGERRHR